MSEYIVELNKNAVSGGKFLLGTVYLDAQELVRCKDCVWAKPDQSDHEFREIRCNMWIADVSADGFCSRGKRKP